MQQVCASPEQLWRLLEHQLSPGDREVVEKHIEDCAACQKVLEELTCDPHLDAQLNKEAGLVPSNALRPAYWAPKVGSRPVVPGYEVLGELGRGGMGVVYQARHLTLKRVVALKMILSGPYASAADLARFRSEAEAVARLQHPNIVQVFEVGEHDNQPYLALEFVDGDPLTAQLTGTPLPARWAAELIETLARAMDYAHQRGVVHRDLKPANVLVQRGPEFGSRGERRRARTDTPVPVRSSALLPKIVDFGLAKQLGLDPGHTSTGVVLGSPSYMAPEQASGKGRDIGPTADIYALGAILYEMLTGRPPFKGASAIETLQQVQTQEPVPPVQLQPHCPRDLETICLKCLEKEARKRYATAIALADDLHRFLQGEPIHARPLGPLGRLAKSVRRRPATALLVLLLLLVTTLGFALVTWKWLDADELREQANQNAQKARASAERESLSAAAEYRSAQAARRAQQQSEQRNIELLLHTGLTQAEAGQPGRGLLWLAQGLQRAVQTRDADMERTLRTILGGRQPAIHPLQAVLPSRELVVVRALSADGQRVLTGGEKGTALLWDTTTGKVLATLAHRARVTSVSFSPDSKWALTTSYDCSAQIWEAATGQAHGPPLLHQDAAEPPPLRKVFTAAFSPDSKEILTGGADQIGRLWDTDGKLLREFPHGSPIVGVAFSPEPGGKAILTRSWQAAQVWDRATGQRQGDLLPHAPKLHGALFSADGLQVLTHSWGDPLIRFWDAATGKPSGKLLRHEGGVFSLVLSTDGKFLLSASEDFSARQWNLRTGKERHPRLIHDSSVYRAVFSPDGNLILTASEDQTARLWDAGNGRPLGNPLQHPSAVVDVAFARDSRLLMTFCRNDAVRLWRVGSGHLPRRTLPHASTVSHLEFSPSGQSLLTSTVGKIGQVWDIETGTPRGPAVALLSKGRRFSFSPAGKTVLIATEADEVACYCCATGKQLGRPFHPEGGAQFVQFSATGQVALTWARNGRAHLWEVEKGRPLGGSFCHPKAVTSAAFSPDGKTLLTGCEDQQVRLWDTARGVLLGEPFPHPSVPSHVSFAPDGKTFRVGDADRKVWLWEVATRQLIGGAPLTHRILHQAVFSTDGRRLLLFGQDGTARLWDSATGKPLTPPLEHRDMVRAGAISPDNRLVLTGSQDRTARLWDARDGLPLGNAIFHRGAVVCGRFSPDGRLFLTGSHDGTLRLWDTQTRHAVGPGFQHRGAVEWAEFSPDGRQVASGAGDGKARIWEVPTPYTGSAEELLLWSRVATGLELDAGGAPRVIDLDTWRKYAKKSEW